MNCRLSSQQVRAWCCRPEPLLAAPRHDLACTMWSSSYFGRCQPCTCAVMHLLAAHATLIWPNRVVEEKNSVCSARSVYSFFRILLVLAVPLAGHSSLGQIGIGIVPRAIQLHLHYSLQQYWPRCKHHLIQLHTTPTRLALSHVNDAASDLVADPQLIAHAVRRHRQQPWPA